MPLTELTAVYLHERFRFANANGDVIIANARPVDETNEIGLKGPAEDGELRPRLTYRFFGQWTEYKNKRTNQIEKQFSFKTFVEVQPYGQEGVKRYLTQLDGIGLVTASHLWNAYGSNAVKTLRDEPELASAAVPKLTAKVAEAASIELRRKLSLEGCTIELIELLDGRGFPKETAKRAIREWGNEAPRYIKRNPYLLMHFRGCGFGRCDALYLDLGLPPGSLKRQALCAWNAIARNSNGHTWHFVGGVEKMLQEQIGGTEVRAGDAIRLAVRAKLLTEKWSD